MYLRDVCLFLSQETIKKIEPLKNKVRASLSCVCLYSFRDCSTMSSTCYTEGICYSLEIQQLNSL